MLRRELQISGEFRRGGIKEVPHIPEGDFDLTHGWKSSETTFTLEDLICDSLEMPSRDLEFAADSWGRALFQLMQSVVV
jgi:hypothetical protein